MTQRTIFVPLALKQAQAEALMSAAHIVLQSAMVAQQTDTPEYVDLKEAHKALADARDAELMKDALTGDSTGPSPGEIMLQRIQRDLASEGVPGDVE